MEVPVLNRVVGAEVTVVVVGVEVMVVEKGWVESRLGVLDSEEFVTTS
jgi:hypothetical protein